MYGLEEKLSAVQIMKIIAQCAGVLIGVIFLALCSCIMIPTKKIVQRIKTNHTRK